MCIPRHTLAQRPVILSENGAGIPLGGVDHDYDFHRENLRKHLSFGFGIHRCMGNRVAELQLHTLWEEILKRYERIEVVGEPERSLSVFVNGYKKMQVILHPKT